MSQEILMNHQVSNQASHNHAMGDMGHDMPGMPGMGGERCAMNMIFTWDWHNTCVVFEWWHIKTYAGFIASFFAIVALGVGYEYIKALFGNWERSSIASGVSTSQQKRFKLYRGIIYGVQVFYSFWLMLVFMTYNGWLMIAVAMGAGIGNYICGGTGGSTDAISRSMSCH